jgi:hypothetical protein
MVDAREIGDEIRSSIVIPQLLHNFIIQYTLNNPLPVNPLPGVTFLFGGSPRIKKRQDRGAQRAGWVKSPLLPSNPKSRNFRTSQRFE